MTLRDDTAAQLPGVYFWLCCTHDLLKDPSWQRQGHRARASQVNNRLYMVYSRVAL